MGRSIGGSLSSVAQEDGSRVGIRYNRATPPPEGMRSAEDGAGPRVAVGRLPRESFVSRSHAAPRSTTATPSTDQERFTREKIVGSADRWQTVRRCDSLAVAAPGLWASY